MVLAITVDTLVSGVHFPADTPPADIGYKALAVNVSDLAAMGAWPDWAVISLTMPEHDEDWISDFQRGFHELAHQYGIRLMAGNFGSGPLAVTIQIHGQVPAEQALHRDGARAGDLIFVTGTLGDAGLALARCFTRERWPDLAPEHQVLVERRLAHPIPRVKEGMALRGIASSAIDISDGLIADLSHIVRASRAAIEQAGLSLANDPSGNGSPEPSISEMVLGAVLHAEKLPLSPALRALPDPMSARRLALLSGDDYELCFTVPKGRQRALMQAAEQFSCPITCIGHMESHPVPYPEVQFSGRHTELGREIFSSGGGYRHFQ